MTPNTIAVSLGDIQLIGERFASGTGYLIIRHRHHDYLWTDIRLQRGVGDLARALQQLQHFYDETPLT